MRIKSLLNLLLLAITICGSVSAKAQVSSTVNGRLMTSWASKLNAQHPLPTYPRPQLKRPAWQNLNGYWNYAITPADQKSIPLNFDGKILVPFAIESALSGVQKTVGKQKALWYQTKIQLKKPRHENRLILHFGAVDWHTDLFINGKIVVSHEGGYDPFSFDITDYLNKSSTQQIIVRVWDPTDEGPQPRGKQVSKPEGIWYTSVTGIWQTVWMEQVPATYIVSTRQTPDIDHHSLQVSTSIINAEKGDQLKYTALDGSSVVGSLSVNASDKAPAIISIKDPHLWSPSDPHLYQLKISITRKGKTIDQVESYFAMRKSSLVKDKDSISKMALNNLVLFQYGPLDQGYWPDGLYTAPTDDALKYDIIQTKNMGFNMIRKHIKVEPALWYYYCDSIGMLVWQDMPSGDLGGNSWDNQPGKISGGNKEKKRSLQSEGYYKKQWKAIMDATHNFPCIIVWTPFNEAWGQFKTKEICEWTKHYDPSRLVNSASGGNFFKTGDILDLHNYPDPAMPDPAVFGNEGRALVLGEFGGLGLAIEGHTWQEKKGWGYQSYKNQSELTKRYRELMKDLKKLVSLGLSAAVYTQTTDVEVETNGLMTYDRKIIKIPIDTLRALHKPLFE